MAPWAAVSAALVISQPCFAALDTSTDTQRIEREELKQNDDPTILRRRVWWENEYSNLHQGAWQHKLTLGGLYAFSLSPDSEWGVRLKVPVVWANGGRDPVVDNQAGLGDVELAVATAIVLFGFNSGAALATVVGVLVEVPVMLSVVRITTATSPWYERATRRSLGADAADWPATAYVEETNK